MNSEGQSQQSKTETTQSGTNFIDMEEFNRARGLNKDQNCLEPQRAFNFKSIPADISFRLESEKWGEVFKFHPVLKVS
jgi:hypothetical protein